MSATPCSFYTNNLLPPMNFRLLLVLLLLVDATWLFAQEWQMALPQRATYSITANPKNPASLLAGNMARTLFSSLDGGQSWQELFVRDPGGASLMTTVMFHPSDTSIVFAGGLGFSGLDRSTDRGETWRNVFADPIGNRCEVPSASAIAVDPVNPDVMYIMRSNPGIVYRSNDRGETWDSLSAMPGLSPTDKMFAIAVDPRNPSVMLASGFRSIMFRSTDTGKTWSVVDSLRAWPDAETVHIRFSATQADRVYAVVRYNQVFIPNSGGLHVSNDDGVTWEPMKFTDTALNALEIYPTKSGDEIFVGGASLSISLPELKGDSIAYRSVDGGNTWQDLSNVEWTKNELDVLSANIWGFARTEIDGRPEILMATECGVYRSTAVTSVKDPRPEQSGEAVLELRGNALLVRLPQSSSDGIVVISDILGRVVSQITCAGAQEHVLPLPDLHRGTYIASVVDGRHRSSIIVQR